MVDVIIPIYNAYDDLCICLESIYKYTDLVNNRLILINDNSSDIRISELLERQVGSKHQVIVINNESNKGFSANINMGMRQSEKNDVILLNSDTVVTKGWIEKITTCAYSRDEIGTVTPLSNNATLCSVPRFCEENHLPDGMDVDTAAAVIERISMHLYPRITVAHGFCMFVKRQVINTIGMFDAETFGRGYGEENDFCNRAEQAGYIHVMCDDTYIYHSGTKSFISKEKEEYIRQHDLILNRRYPEQMHKNAVHVRDNPNHIVGENVDLFFRLANGKDNILFLVHSDFREGATDNVGGTQYHVRDLVFGMMRDYNVFVVAKDGEKISVTIYCDDYVKVLFYDVLTHNDYYMYTEEKQKAFWLNILAAFEIKLVHVHHTSGMTFDVFHAAKELNIPYIVTLHDYYTVCPRIRLLDQNDKICNCAENTKHCVECMRAQGISDKIDFVSIWRKKWSETLDGACKVIVPSDSAKKIMEQYYPMIGKEMASIEHGCDKSVLKDYSIAIISSGIRANFERLERRDNGYVIEGWGMDINFSKGNTRIWLCIESVSEEDIVIPASLIRRDDVTSDERFVNCGFSIYVPNYVFDRKDISAHLLFENDGVVTRSESEIIATPKEVKRRKAKLNVAFIGGLNNSKGGKEVVDIVKQGSDDVDWYVFGTVGTEELVRLNKCNLIKTGSYKPDELPSLLKNYKIDIVCILSIWPETYSYTLTESILNSIPVIVTDIGALGDRTETMQCGWKVKTTDIPSGVNEVVDLILKDRDILKAVKEKVSNIEIKSIEKMCDEYAVLYNRFVIKKSRETKKFDTMLVLGNVQKLEISEELDYLNQRYFSAFNELEHLKGTIGYRVMRYIQKVHFPGKNIIEKNIKRRIR